MALLNDPQVVTVPEAGRILGIGRSASYEAARRGDLPVIRIGRRYLAARPRNTVGECLGV